MNEHDLNAIENNEDLKWRLRQLRKDLQDVAQIEAPDPVACHRVAREIVDLFVKLLRIE
jgi:hypothetical protein